MKNFKLLIIALLAVGTITSCMKNDYVDDFDYEKEKARIDSTLEAQKDDLAAYAAEHFSSNMIYNEVTGMYLDTLAAATDRSYNWVVSGNGYNVPKITVKYTGRLLNGTVFEDASATAQAFLMRPDANINVTNAWIRAFLPRTITINGESQVFGMIADGVKKGHKFKFIAPSPYVYDNKERKNSKGEVIVPKDSPVEYTVEVIDIVDQM